MTEPVLTVVHGSPTPEEIAALVVVLMSRPPTTSPAPQPNPSGWSAYRRGVRAPLAPGPGAWRTAADRL